MSESGDPDPMDPEAWQRVPDVCGSCIAWRSSEARATDEVATGACKLRPEMGRVPADLRKCTRYMPRGQFVYQPGKAPRSPKRRAAKTIAIVRQGGDSIETKEVRAPAIVERMTDGPREPRPAGPREVELGDVSSPEVVRWAIAELLRQEYGRSQRDLHPRFKQGKVVAESGDGRTKEVTAERFFGMIDRLKSSLENAERAIDQKSAAIGAEAAELKAQLRALQGSFTTFNLLFADKDDYFSSK